MDPQEAQKGPLRVIGFDSFYGIVYAELADGSFMSADFIEPILRVGRVEIDMVPTQPVAAEYVVKEMISSESWVEIDEIFENWIEAIKALNKDWQYSSTAVRRGRRHAMTTGEPLLFDVSSGPTPGLLEESTGKVTFPQGSTFSNSILTMSPLYISKSISITERGQPISTH